MKKIFFILLAVSYTNLIFGQDASRIIIHDTRSVNSEPSFYQRSVNFEFKYSSILNAPYSSYYGGLMTIAPWRDATGNKNHQLFFNDNGILYRTGVHGQSTWAPWQKIVIQDMNGRVGINTSDTKGHNLAVNGTILAKEIKVETGWADFVFDKDYKLPSLAEVEKHIQEKGHLQGIPTEAEVKENGVNLGEMNVKLLQKVEELTLYIIKHEKENKEKEKQIDHLLQRIEELEKHIK
ncbi:MAG: hypothetical protein Q4G63_11425 [Bacteroidia bacterium]|nr:hypothetical protein [Bacteroidia bacterium]